jgi:low affinity Fe/Cu permease
MRRFFGNLASKSAYLMGHPGAFIGATLACIIWAISGPLFNYSDTWQLVINTATTVLTFLAVFLIQNSQNRDGAAIQAKLDEILIAVKKARSEFVGIEHLTDEELETLRKALEREALEPDGDPEDGLPSVKDILAGRHHPNTPRPKP